MNTDSFPQPPDVMPEKHETEEILFEGKIPVRAFLARYNVLLFLIVGWNVGLAVSYVRSLAWKVKLTSQRLVIVRGLISQKEEDIPLYRATDCCYRQSITGRLLNAGEITLVAEDATSPQVTFPFIAPARYKELIRERMMAERRRNKTIALD